MHGNDNEDEDEEFEKGLFKLESIKTQAGPVPDDFLALDMVDQVSYTLPVIDAIMEDRYTPTKELNAIFMKGGRARLELKRQTAPTIGTLTRKDAHKVAKVLECYLLRLGLGAVKNGIEHEDVQMVSADQADTPVKSDVDLVLVSVG